MIFSSVYYIHHIIADITRNIFPVYIMIKFKQQLVIVI
ncbi:hypothetical protein ES703_89836 [subsurface metagenome]